MNIKNYEPPVFDKDMLKCIDKSSSPESIRKRKALRPEKQMAMEIPGLAKLGSMVVTDEQWNYIYNLHEQTGWTISCIIREAIDLFIAKHEKDLDNKKN